MSEILDLIAVLGAVDDAVKPRRASDSPADTGAAGDAPETPDHPEPPQIGSAGPQTHGPPVAAADPQAERRREQRRQLKRLVPVYEDPASFGWYERFNDYGRRRGQDLDRDVGSALRSLATPTTSPAMLPRRVVAIALAARAFPERFGPHGAEAEAALDALTIPGIVKGLPPVVPPLPSPLPPPLDPDLTTAASAEAPDPARETGGAPPPAADEPDGSDDDGDDDNGGSDDDGGSDNDGSDNDSGGSGNYANAEPEIQERALDLLSALADPAELRRIEDWRRFLDRYDHLVNPQLFSLPAPCSARIITTDQGAKGTTVLRTDLCLDGADLATVADRFLEPRLWTDCNPWWCDMAHAGWTGDLPRLLEKVASQCSLDHTPALFDVAVFLDFARIDKGPDRQLLTYKMSPPPEPVGKAPAGTQPKGQRDTLVAGKWLKANNAVRVDEGVIEVRRDGDHLRVATTKRVQFTDLEASVVAVLACWVGYGDVGAEMILNCTGGTVRAVRCGESAIPADTGLVSDLLALAHDYVSDAAAEAHRVLDRAGSGTYGVGDATEDAKSTLKLAVRGWQDLATTVLGQPIPGEATALAADEQAMRSRVFGFDPPLPADCSLALGGKLRSRHKDEVPAANVTIAPAEVRAGDKRFHLDVKTKGLGGGFFEGVVQARDAETDQVVAVAPVDVIVP